MLTGLRYNCCIKPQVTAFLGRTYSRSGFSHFIATASRTKLREQPRRPPSYPLPHHQHRPGPGVLLHELFLCLFQFINIPAVHRIPQHLEGETDGILWLSTSGSAWNTFHSKGYPSFLPDHLPWFYCILYPRFPHIGNGVLVVWVKGEVLEGIIYILIVGYIVHIDLVEHILVNHPAIMYSEGNTTS